MLTPSPDRLSLPGRGPIPVLLLVTTLDRGGAEKMVTRLALGLPRSKYAVQVGALQGRSRAIVDELGRASVPVHYLGMRAKWDCTVVPRLARLVRREAIEILFAFLFHPTGIEDPADGGELFGRDPTSVIEDAG